MENLNRIIQHNVLEQWPLPDKSVQCIITSPPYWNLRDYGVQGQLGLEKTPEEFIDNMVKVFQEAWRVLRDDGTLWINIGDSYMSTGGKRTEANATAKSTLNGGLDTQIAALRGRCNPTGGALKNKDLVGIPWMLAFALRADGWYLRQDIIWHKPNVMPESVTDRFTKAHEYLFLFSKSKRYFFDQEAVLEAVSQNTHARISQKNFTTQAGSDRAFGGDQRKKGFKTVGRRLTDTRKRISQAGSGIKYNESFNAAVTLLVAKRNKRSVWTIPPTPFKEAHFATFPKKLPMEIIKCGSSEHGCCSACGAPYTRILEPSEAYKKVLGKSYHDHQQDLEMGAMQNRGRNQQNDMVAAGIYAAEYVTVGWKPGCECGASIAPCVILDPFMGAGTTGLAARLLGRNFFGLELNPKYITIADRRLKKELGLFH